MTPQATLRAAAAAIVLLAASPSAFAQATRTWVSGVGDDANPCSRTAPCKTFAGAISKTAALGEINVLDPGGFGGVTITKSISIIADDVEAGVLVSGTNGIIVNAGANDVVVLRGLDIEGLGTGLSGIRFLAGSALFVEDCTINNFSGAGAGFGIDFSPAGTSQLHVTDTIIRNHRLSGGGGIIVRPGVAGNANVFLDNVRLHRNNFGIRVQDRSTVTIRGGSIEGNSTNGLFAVGATAVTNLDGVTVAFNTNAGILVSGVGATVRMTKTTVTGNGTGLAPGTGAIISFTGTNSVGGNTVDGAPTGPNIPPI
jgi:hypothetical protein